MINKINNLTHELDDGLFLIDLPQNHSDLPGFHHFISAWFFRDALGRRVLVDPGPANTIPLLNSELEKLTDNIDLVLLSHIHMDHAGGVGQFSQRWPNARYILHPRGIRHMRNPERLWRASVDTLGDVARMYGEMLPLPEAISLSDHDDLDAHDNLENHENSNHARARIIEIFETPGHAPHNLSMRVKAANGKKLFFLGEAVNITCPTLDGTLYTRPATPHKFDPVAEDATLNMLESILDDKTTEPAASDELLCFAHWGLLDNKHDGERVSPRKFIRLAREQLQYWTEIISSMRDAPIPDIVSYLMEHDKLLQSPLEPDLRERERLFMANSVTGILKAL